MSSRHCPNTVLSHEQMLNNGSGEKLAENHPNYVEEFNGLIQSFFDNYVLYDQGGLSAISQIQLECAFFPCAAPSEGGKWKSNRYDPFYLYFLSCLCTPVLQHKCPASPGTMWLNVQQAVQSQLSGRALRTAQLDDIQLLQVLIPGRWNLSQLH